MLFSSRACSNPRSILEPGRGSRGGSGDGSLGGSTSASGGGGGGGVRSARGARRSDAVPTDARPARAPPEPSARPALCPASQGRSLSRSSSPHSSPFPRGVLDAGGCGSQSRLPSPWAPCSPTLGLQWVWERRLPRGKTPA